MASVFLIACGGTASTTVDTIDAANFEDYQADDETPIWRYVNSGWVVPVKEKYSDAFSRDLRVVIITSDAEMQQFNREVISKRTNGTGATLGRPKYPESVVVAAYLLWLPVKGDPLSVVGMAIEGKRVVVDLELEEDAQGRELPYLYAPMTMVMVDRSELPLNGPVDFAFMLDGDLMATARDSLR